MTPYIKYFIFTSLFLSLLFGYSNKKGEKMNKEIKTQAEVVGDLKRIHSVP